MQERTQLQEGTLLQEKAPTTRQDPNDLAASILKLLQERTRLQEGILLQEKAPTTRQVPNDRSV